MDIESNRNAIPARYVGAPSARLVTGDLLQIQELVYCETYAQYWSLHPYALSQWLLNIFSLELHHMDVITAFLEKYIFKCLYGGPEGMTEIDRTSTTFEVVTSLCGSKQAHRRWNTEIDEFIKLLEFTRSSGYHASMSNGKWWRRHDHCFSYQWRLLEDSNINSNNWMEKAIGGVWNESPEWSKVFADLQISWTFQDRILWPIGSTYVTPLFICISMAGFRLVDTSNEDNRVLKTGILWTI